MESVSNAVPEALGFVDGPGLVALGSARRPVRRLAAAEAGRRLRGWPPVCLERWEWMLCARGRRLPFRELGSMGNLRREALPSKSCAWLDLSSNSVLMKRSDGPRRVVRDPDAVLDDAVVEADEVFEATVDGVVGSWMQIKLLLDVSTPPIVLYERRLEAVRDLGLDAPGSRAALAEFSAVVVENSTWSIALKVPKDAWCDVRWPSVGMD